MLEKRFRCWDDEYKEMIYDVGVIDGKAHDLRLLISRMVPLETSAFEAISKIVDSKIILMQYTGLKDKNGKEIYEGDILSHEEESEPECNIVEYRVDYAAYFCSFFELCDAVSSHEIVVGNIYENPELLK